MRFFKQRMNSLRRKCEESEAIVCVSAGVSEESIATIASVASLSICRTSGRGGGWRGGGVVGGTMP